jgi:hypothetical protein
MGLQGFVQAIGIPYTQEEESRGERKGSIF